MTKPKPKKPAILKLHNNYRYIVIDSGLVVYDSSVDFTDGFKTKKEVKSDASRWQDNPVGDLRIKYYKGRKEIK